MSSEDLAIRFIKQINLQNNISNVNIEKFNELVLNETLNLQEEADNESVLTESSNNASNNYIADWFTSFKNLFIASNSINTNNNDTQSIQTNLDVKEKELADMQENIAALEKNIQTNEALLLDLQSKLEKAKTDKQLAEKTYEAELKEYEKKIAEAQEAAQSAYENQELQEGETPKSYEDFYNAQIGSLKAPVLDTSLFDDVISLYNTKINQAKSSISADKAELTSLNTKATSLNNEIEQNKVKLSALNSTNTDDAQDNSSATSANNRGTRTSTITTIPPVINGNVVTFGNGKTIEIPSGTTAKLSDDGQSVLLTSESQSKKPTLTRYSNGNKSQYYTKYSNTVKYDINGNAVEERSEAYRPKTNSKTKEIEYKRSESNDVIIQRKFDDYGNCIREVEQSQAKNSAVEYDYYDDNRVKEERNFKNSILPVSVSKYEYDDTKNKVTKTTTNYGTSRGLGTGVTVKDTVSNTVVEETTKDDCGNVIIEAKCRYTSKGHSSNYSSTNYINEYEYDSDGNIVKKTKNYYGKDGEKNYYGYDKYDTNGKRTEWEKPTNSYKDGVYTYYDDYDKKKYVTTTDRRVYTNQDGIVTDITAFEGNSCADVQADGTLSIRSTEDFGSWAACANAYIDYPAGSKILSYTVGTGSNGWNTKFIIKIQKPDGSIVTCDTDKISSMAGAYRNCAGGSVPIV